MPVCFFPTEGYTSFIRMEMLIIQWSKRGSGKIVISTLIMFSLPWWPFLQYPLLKAGQREWILLVFMTVTLSRVVLCHLPAICGQQSSLKWWHQKLLMEEGKKTSILLNLWTFSVFLHSPLSIKGKLILSDS